ncbi:MAG: hypothetical protein K1060chlam4_00251 [Candidatus Anoxychlamydiales bacterium]|nr:hypothetical protein [Candidatus Anoxychlamydiales bacterium]
MAAVSNRKPSFRDSVGTKFHETKKDVSKSFQTFGRKVESIKNSIKSTLSATASKIKKFVEKNYINVIFAVLSISALIHGPYRFLFASVLGLAIQKVNNKIHKRAVTSTNLALNILGIIGVILEKTICPICDPTYYLAPCISGIATSEALYNLYRNFSKKEITPAS